MTTWHPTVAQKPTRGRIKDVDALVEPFRTKVKWLHAELNREGLPFTIYETLRTPQRQVYLFSMGRKYVDGSWEVVEPRKVVTNAGPGSSAHQYGLAVDFVLDIFGVNKWCVRSPYNRMWRRLGAIAGDFGLEWGGDWRSIKDLPHIQQRDWRNLRPAGWREEAKAVLAHESRRYV